MIDFLQDLWGFMRERKKFWLAPIIMVMVLLRLLCSLRKFGIGESPGVTHYTGA